MRAEVRRGARAVTAMALVLSVAACVRSTGPSAAPVPTAPEPATLAPATTASTTEVAHEAEREPVTAPPATPPPAQEPPAPPPSEPAPKAAAPTVTAPKKSAVSKDDPLLLEVLGRGGPALKRVLAAPEEHRFQVIYGAIVTRDGKPMLERHSFRADAEYFFPASSMKVPIAFATYQRLASLRRGGKIPLTRDSTVRLQPVRGRGEPWVTTLARETRRSLIVSDNFSANRMLAFVGHRELHEGLWSFGLASARVRTGFATGAELDPAEESPAIEVLVDGVVSGTVPARRSDLVLPPTDAKGLDIGTAKVVDGRRVDGPLAFGDKNAMKLRDLQDVLVQIMRPELVPARPPRGKKGAPLDAPSTEDLEHLRQTLGTLPSESGIAGYDRNVVADYQLSPFLRGIERVRPRGKIRVFSKVGQAYGFLIHNAYVVESDTGRAFFLIAIVYANPEGLMNSDRYAYDTIAFPALADVGEAIARHAFAE